MVRFRLPYAEAERGFVLQDEGRAAAPSARSDGLDDVDGGPDGAVYIQVGGIEQDGVFGLLQGRRGAVHVARGALTNVVEHGSFVERVPGNADLGGAAAGAGLG